jgi:hypothetical protein
VIGLPVIQPWSFPAAISDPEKVTTAADLLALDRSLWH